MKKITIVEKDWGPDYLLADGKFDGIEGKMCCLGFACLALGKSREELKGRAMPEDVKITEFSGDASEELIKFAGPSISTPPNGVPTCLARMASEANDAYHAERDQATKGHLLEIMKRAFTEAGFEFVLDRSK